MLTVSETGGQRAALGERVATRFYPMRDALSLERRWPIYTVLAAILLLVVALTGPATRWIGQQLHSSASDRAVLAAAGFGDLSLTEGSNGPMIHGIVKDDAELARLRLLVSERIGAGDRRCRHDAGARRIGHRSAPRPGRRCRGRSRGAATACSSPPNSCPPIARPSSNG